MSDTTLLSLIPGLDDKLHHLGESLGHAYPSFLAGNHVLKLVPAVMLLLVVVFLLVLAGAARGRLSKVDEAVIPDAELNARTFFELFLDTLMGLMTDIMGAKNAKRFLPLLGTCGLLILFSNLLGLVPGFVPPTDNLNVTAALALVIFFATHIVGVQTNGIGHITHMMNPVGAWWGWFLAPIMFPIELIGHLARPMSLSLRLMGNMIGDHKVLGIFLTLTAVPIVYPVPIIGMGVLVCVVQTAVFCLLSMIYIGLAVEEQHHDEGGHH